MPQPVADRNLLFGILALQMDFITRDQLLAAMQAWVFDKNKSLGEILCSQNALDKEHTGLLDALVQKHLAKHNNDTEKSLAAVNPAGNLRRDLERIADADVQASLQHVSLAPAQKGDPYATIMPTPSMVAAAGSLRFRIVRPYARGGLGEVFVALDEELHREVALKEIQERQADNLDSRSRFVLEAEITGGLEHPGIVPVYGLGTYPDGRPYYAMRFIRGDSLKEAIDRFHKNQTKMSAGDRALELRDLLGRLVDVCNAIHYAHSRGVLHRDLKPGNIMLGKYGETLVVDWGLAKPLGHPLEDQKTVHEPGEGSLVPSSLSSASETILGTAVGTPQYMSPEQAAGKLDQLGPASDVYSLGATLYCILTGVAPIGGNDVGDMLRRVERGDFQKPSQVVSGIAQPLEAICLKAMALKPTDRYPTPHELADDIEHWLADEPVTAYPEPWTTKARRWIGRNATLVTGVASAIVVALVGLIVTTILLTAANERERLAKQKAEENFKMAHDAVNRYLTAVSEEALLNEKGMQPLRKKLLEAAEEFHVKFIKEREGDPALQGELAQATFRLGLITDVLGSNADAIKRLEQAAKLFEALPAAKAGADFQSDQATCYHHLGRLYRGNAQLAESEKDYLKALKFWEPLVEAHPKERSYQAGLARTLMGIGNLQQDERKLDSALATYEKSLKAWQALAQANPDAPEFQRELATNQNNLAVIYQTQAGKEADAEKWLRAAYTTQKKLADDWPNISKYQEDLARISFNLARTLKESTGATPDTEGYFQEAANRWQMLAMQNPAVTKNQVLLAEANMALADIARANGDLKKAELHSQKALSIQRRLIEKQKDDDARQSDLARGLFTFAEVCRANTQVDRTNEALTAYEDAARIQEKLSAQKSESLQYQRDLARTYNGIGDLHAQAMREEKASKAYKEALARWEKLAKERPKEHEYAVGVSRSCYSLGNLAKFAGNFKDAEPWFTRAITTFDGMNAKVLATVPVKGTLLSSLMMRAETETQLKQFDKSLADWNRAYDLAPSVNKPGILLSRAAALARTGKYAEAIADVSPLAGKAKAGPSLYRLACVYALAAGAAKDKKNLADEYAAEAIRLLNAARDRKYFNSLNEQKLLHDAADLDALRERPEFKKLLSEFK